MTFLVESGDCRNVIEAADPQAACARALALWPADAELGELIRVHGGGQLEDTYFHTQLIKGIAHEATNRKQVG